MGIHNGAARAVVDGGFQVLDERAIAPDVQGLRAVADSEDRLLEVESVLEKQLVYGRSGRIRRAAFGDSCLAIPFRINIIATAGEQDSLDSQKQFGNAVLALVEGKYDWGCTGGFEGGKVRRQRTLVVSGITAGGLRDCDMDCHSATSVSLIVNVAEGPRRGRST
jgi:hypothetical protein